MTLDEKKAVLRELLREFVACVKAAPRGVPEGHLYAVLMSKLTLDQFNQLVDACVQLGALNRSNHLLTPGPYADKL